MGISFPDLLIAAVLLAFAVKGFMKGLVKELCSLAGLIGGVWAACRFYPSAAAKVEGFLHLPPRAAVAVAFLLILFVALSLFFFLGNLLTVALKVALLGGVNRMGGALFGLLQGGFLAAVVMHFLLAQTFAPVLRQRLAASASGPFLAECGAGMTTGWQTHVAKRQPQQDRSGITKR